MAFGTALLLSRTEHGLDTALWWTGVCIRHNVFQCKFYGFALKSIKLHRCAHTHFCECHIKAVLGTLKQEKSPLDTSRVLKHAPQCKCSICSIWGAHKKFLNSYLRWSFISELLPHHQNGPLLFSNVFDERKKASHSATTKLEYFRRRMVRCFYHMLHPLCLALRWP